MFFNEKRLALLQLTVCAVCLKQQQQQQQQQKLTSASRSFVENNNVTINNRGMIAKMGRKTGNVVTHRRKKLQHA